MKYTCPVCGYMELEDPPEDYNICPCCGTEFDLDDFDTPYTVLRARWIDRGMKWFSCARKQPANWNPQEQLRAAGFL